MNKTNLLKIISYLNTYKTKLKAAHWAETTSMNKHEQLDKLYDVVDKFQDEFVEESVILSEPINQISEIPDNILLNINSTEELIEHISKYAVIIKNYINKLQPTAVYSGLSGLTDSFIHDINIIRFRYQMN